MKALESFLYFCISIFLYFYISVFLYFRAETEVEGAGKLSGQDKALLSAVWIPALVYALMSRQVKILTKLIVAMIILLMRDVS